MVIVIGLDLFRNICKNRNAREEKKIVKEMWGGIGKYQPSYDGSHKRPDPRIKKPTDISLFPLFLFFRALILCCECL